MRSPNSAPGFSPSYLLPLRHPNVNIQVSLRISEEKQPAELSGDWDLCFPGRPRFPRQGLLVYAAAQPLITSATAQHRGRHPHRSGWRSVEWSSVQLALLCMAGLVAGHEQRAAILKLNHYDLSPDGF